MSFSVSCFSCKECYNHITNQRNIDLLQIPTDIQVKNSGIKNDKLILTCEYKEPHMYL